MLWNTYKIEDIFYSNPNKGGVRGSVGSYETIANWINAGYLKVKMGEYPEHNIPVIGQDALWDKISSNDSTESLEHKKLKFWGAKLLKDAKYQTVEIEKTHEYTFIDRVAYEENGELYISELYKSGTCDVMGYHNGNRIIMECGNTEPIKALWAFYQRPNLKCFIQMPYTISNNKESIHAAGIFYIFELTGMENTQELIQNELIEYFIREHVRTNK